MRTCRDYAFNAMTVGLLIGCGGEGADVPDAERDAPSTDAAADAATDGPPLIPIPMVASIFTAQAGWAPTQVLGESLGIVPRGQAGIDPTGAIVAVWGASNGTRQNIWARRYVPGNGWGSAELIESDDAGDAQGPRIAVDPAGNAIAVWTQSDGAREDVWANHFVSGAGWGTAVRIETAPDNALACQPACLDVAIDPNGNAVAAWIQTESSGRSSVWANRFVPGAGWGTALLIEQDDSGSALGPDIGVDSQGRAMVTWRIDQPGNPDATWVNRYVPSSGWGAPTRIDDGHGYEVPRIAVNADGDAIVVWNSDFPQNVWANRYTPGGGWGSAMRLDNASGFDSAGNARISLDPLGNAIAVWQQGTASGQRIWANRFDPAMGWGTPAPTSDASSSAGFAHVASDASGGSVAVWIQTTAQAPARVWASGHTVMSGWSAPQLLETETAANSTYPELTGSAQGDAVALWSQVPPLPPPM